MFFHDRFMFVTYDDDNDVHNEQFSSFRLSTTFSPNPVHLFAAAIPEQ